MNTEPTFKSRNELQSLKMYPPTSVDGHEELARKRLSVALKSYDRHKVASLIGGLLMEPRLQANCYRLELLAEMALSHCKGKKIPNKLGVSSWLNHILGGRGGAVMEDPPEEVFVANVITPNSDYLVLSGINEYADASTNLLIKVIQQFGGPNQREWLKPSLELLKLSDFLLRRAGLSRWEHEESYPTKNISLPADLSVEEICAKASVSEETLIAAGFDVNELNKFNLSDESPVDSLTVAGRSIGSHSKPLLKVGTQWILYLPTAVSFACNSSIIEHALTDDDIVNLQRALLAHVSNQALIWRKNSKHDVELLELDQEAIKASDACSSIVFRLGLRKYFHLLFVSDDLYGYQGDCFGAPYQSDYYEAQIGRNVESVRAYIEAQPDFDYGVTLRVAGHLGQGFALDIKPIENKWIDIGLRFHEMEILMKDDDFSLESLLLLLKQKDAMESQGLEISNYNGLLNLFCFWKNQGYSLRPVEAPVGHPAYIQIPTDCHTSQRIKARHIEDEHCRIHVTGKRLHVVRMNAESIFKVVQDLPVWVSTKHLQNGIHSFCIEQGNTTIWLSFYTSHLEGQSLRFARELWEAMQLFLYRFVSMANINLTFDVEAVEVLLDLRKVKPNCEIDRNLSMPIEYSHQEHRALALVTIVPNIEFFSYFGGVHNEGEAKLLSAIIKALGMLSTYQFTDDDLDFLAEACLLGRDAKVLHALHAASGIDHLLGCDKRRVFSATKCYQEATIRSAFSFQGMRLSDEILEIKDSTSALNDAVTNAMNTICKKLQSFNKLQLVNLLLKEHESLLREDQRWRATARAVVSLYGESGSTAAMSWNNRGSVAKLTIRVLIEAAVCESSLTSSRHADGHDIDELFGLMWTLIELGRDSETLFHGMSTSGITIHPNGAYSFEPDLLADVAHFTIDTFDNNLDKAVADYENWVQPRFERPENKRFEDQDFLDAFKDEYGFFFQQLLDITGMLLDCCIEDESVVIVLKHLQMEERCNKNEIDFSVFQKFLKAFALPERSGWKPTPPLAKPKDVEPWRFERKLSLMLRPVATATHNGEVHYIFGAATLRHCIAYVLESTERGRFDKDVFISRLMRSYIGRRVDQLGARFTVSVADELKALGWNARTEVKMTELGASKELGDVDVIAWKNDGRVLLIECKRLKGSRTISEIALTCNRFRGNTGDMLFKHLRRTDWINKNLQSLAKLTKVQTEPNQVVAPLITNLHVPFKYLKELPISAELIWWKGELEKMVEGNPP